MSTQSRNDHTAVIDIGEVAAALLSEAHNKNGRTARTLTPGGGAPLKQTLLALTAGTTLAEHESPGSATLYVVQGRVRLTAGDTESELSTGNFVPIPPTRHSVTSLDDAVLLITVA